MSTHEDQTEIEVWGIPVPVDKRGCRRWPRVIKSMAAERIAAGARVSDIVKETGANDCTVRKWLSRAGDQSPPKLGFIEVKPSQVPSSYPIPEAQAAASSCRIKIGDAVITIPHCYPADHLVQILQAVRGSL
ncbi:hypothetical protein [Paracoccus siganidrum]|uniref:hypothetical protein n=1 Tax=Paracoccus siganidrum TaxID=1276757 RepID=UPI001474A3D8|nr:hypothetical protein [Paracoccus siganidrum]